MSAANDTEPLVSIIIPTKNGARYIGEVLAAIYNQVTAYPFEVILIDSGSTDATLDIAAQYPARAHRIAPETFNHGGTRNLGGQLARAASRYLVFLTQDATPQPGWLNALLQPLEADQEVAGAFSRHVPRPDCNPILARQICEDWEQAGTPRRVVKRIVDRHDFERRKVHYVYFADTSSCLRRSVWERYPFPITDFAEDAQWAETVLLAGYTLVYEPTSAVWHSHSAPLPQHWRRNYEHQRAMAAFQRRGNIVNTSGGLVYHTLATVTRDWRYLWRKHDHSVWWRLYWCCYSPLWHAAGGLGAWLGANAA